MVSLSFREMFGVMIKAWSALWRHVLIIYRHSSSVANGRRFAYGACWKHIAIPHNVKLYTLCILRWRDKSSHNGTKKRFWIATEGMFYVHSLLSTWEFYWRIWIPQESICKHIWPRSEKQISHPSEVRQKLIATFFLLPPASFRRPLEVLHP